MPLTSSKLAGEIPIGRLVGRVLRLKTIRLDISARDSVLYCLTCNYKLDVNSAEVKGC